jgi:hypothetical protein
MAGPWLDPFCGDRITDSTEWAAIAFMQVNTAFRRSHSLWTRFADELTATE